MGGDHAPEAVVAGALQAAPLLHKKLLLVGRTEEIERVAGCQLPENVEIVHASEVIEMHEGPVEALRRKRDSSLSVAAGLVKEGRACAMVSAGNTGAATAVSLITWRQVRGVRRPAIASHIPSKHGGFLLIDAGASPDADPRDLVDFAVMGRAYAQLVLGREQPKVHLLNIGEEDSKGNAFAKEAHGLLKENPWFSGNVEGKDVFQQRYDVVVCDAFVGNIVLKTGEGVAEFILNSIKDQVPKTGVARLMYLPLRRLMAPLRKLLDYSEHGGSPLLGLNGLCTICHGRSDAKAIRNALLATQTAVEHGLVDCIRSSFADRQENGR
jgi:glycerol-3-phosphate acyltransferase PlsX